MLSQLHDIIVVNLEITQGLIGVMTVGIITAFFLIGYINRLSGEQGGIFPTHWLFLTENNRPALVLVPAGIFDDSGGNKKDEKIVWIPSLENIMEDALLMIAIYDLQDEQVSTMARKHIRFIEDKRVEVCQDISVENREKLYHACRLINYWRDIVLAIQKGSLLLKHLNKLEDYRAEFELLLPAGF